MKCLISLWTFGIILLFNNQYVKCSEIADGFVIDAQSVDISTEKATILDIDQKINELVKYDGAQMWRIGYLQQTDKNAVAELQNQFQVSMWNLNRNLSSVDIFVKKSMVADASAYLREVQVPFDIVIDDIQHAIEHENPPKDQLHLWQNRNGHLMTWTSYHRLSDIHGYLEYLAKTYPDLCSVQEIGKSNLGKSLKVLRISNGNPSNKAIWIDGGIHAREWISPAATTFIIDTFSENWSEQPKDIQDIDWYFLPVMNPDGYEYTHTNDRLWRKNRRKHLFCMGVDLNRNYGYKWGGQGASRQPCSETFAGSSAFSEPETKAVKDFIGASSANWKGSISFHSYGQYILYPWGYDRVVPPDHEDLKRVGNAAAAAMKKIGGASYEVGPAGATLYPASGGSDDWAKGDIKIKYSYTVELRDSGKHGFILPADQIIISGEEAMEFVKVLAKAVSQT
ncbi:unnamed protein product [Diamesa serratosioi]